MGPFLGNGDYGVVVDGGVSYRANFPFAVHAALVPYAYGKNETNSMSTYAVRVDASVDTRFVEVGVGTGAQRYVGWGSSTDAGLASHAPSLGFRTRFGALDGLNVTTKFNWTFVGGLSRFSDGFARITIPTWTRGWVFLGGGGGAGLGFATAHAGVRTSALGKNHPERLFLSVSIGWAEVRLREAPAGSQFAWGFQPTFSVEYRL